MALTSYSYISGVTATGLTAAVTASGDAPIGSPVARGSVLLQFIGAGTGSVGSVSDYQVVAGATPDALVTAVTAVLSADLQPVGEPVARGNVLFQVMGKVTAGAGGSYTLPAATLSVLGGVKMGAAVADVTTVTVTDIASAATAIAAIGTTLSELQQSLRASGAISA